MLTQLLQYPMRCNRERLFGGAVLGATGQGVTVLQCVVSIIRFPLSGNTDFFETHPALCEPNIKERIFQPVFDVFRSAARAYTNLDDMEQCQWSPLVLR